MSIEGIYRSPVASMPMESIQEGTLVTGRGLSGDRYCDYKGTYSVLRISEKNPGEREPGRQLTLMSGDSIRDAFERNSLSKPASFGDLRRNIVIHGISADDLLDAVGHTVQLGGKEDGCLVFVHRHCVPCMYNERKNCVPGMMEAIWMESGVSCEVLSGGRIAVSDAVTILPLSANISNHEVDAGTQPPGYFTPPSKRTTAMVLGAIKKSRETKKVLMESDPEGVQRTQSSYETVGLSFWPPDKK